MPSLEAVTDPLANICTPVPAIAKGVCDVCHGSPRPGFDTCHSCYQAMDQVSTPCSLVVPVSLYETRGQLHYYLRSYKDGWTRQLRQTSALLVAALLARFLYVHGGCIRNEAGDWDFVTSVPSSSGRAGVHPFEAALEWVPWLSNQHRRVLGRGAGVATHNNASDDAFRAITNIEGSRVLLIDDTYTTGARAQSAASALAQAGARCVAIVPVGRVISPQFSDDVQAYWDAQRAIRFRFDACCLET